MQALAGRRPLASVPRRLPALGVVSLAAGCGLLATAVAGSPNSSSSGWAFVGLAGGLGLLGGVLAASPWFVGLLERRVGWWPEAWRLAARSLARSRVRSSAVVAAIATVAAGVIGGSTLATSLDGDEGSSLTYLRGGQIAIESTEVRALPPELISPDVDPDDPYGKVTSYPAPIPAEVRTRILAELPDATLVPLDVPTLAGTSPDVPSYGVGFEYVTEEIADPNVYPQMGSGLSIATPPLLDLLEVPRDLRAELDAGKAISVIRPPDGASAIQIDLTPTGATSLHGTTRVTREVSLGGGRPTAGASQVLPTVLISPATATLLRTEPATGRLDHRRGRPGPDGRGAPPPRAPRRRHRVGAPDRRSVRGRVPSGLRERAG